LKIDPERVNFYSIVDFGLKLGSIGFIYLCNRFNPCFWADFKGILKEQILYGVY